MEEKEYTISKIEPVADGRQWFILTTLFPRKSEQRVLAENESRSQSGRPTLQYFIPYQYLQRREPCNRPSEEETPSPDRARVNNAQRAALFRYLFIRASESDLASFLGDQRMRFPDNRLQLLRTRSRDAVTLSDAEMTRFINVCTELNLKFDLVPSLDRLSADEEVQLRLSPLQGERARVLRVRHTREGIDLTLSVSISGQMTLRLYNVRESDVIRLTPGTFGNSHLIDDLQGRLLDIIYRRVYRKQTRESEVRDRALLDRCYNYRYYSVDHYGARCHLLALMLICAHLRRDAEGVSELTADALKTLGDIDGRGASRAATDYRAYLHVALYMATGDPAYRDAVRDYVRDYAPKSEPLRQFLHFIKKQQKI